MGSYTTDSGGIESVAGAGRPGRFTVQASYPAKGGAADCKVRRRHSIADRAFRRYRTGFCLSIIAGLVDIRKSSVTAFASVRKSLTVRQA